MYRPIIYYTFGKNLRILTNFIMDMNYERTEHYAMVYV